MVSIEAFLFFHANAGYIVGERAKCAIRLARAEERAKGLGLEVHWGDEPEAWDGEAPPPKVHACAWVPELDGKYNLASLGSIALDSWRDPYRRVVEAELYAEALAELDERRERAACVEAAELAARATFAGPSEYAAG